LINTIGAQIANVVGLNLSDNGIGDEGLALLFEGLYNCSSLTSLYVDRNFSAKVRLHLQCGKTLSSKPSHSPLENVGK